MRAKEFMQEIDYSASLQDLPISDRHLIAKSTVVGEIDGQDIHLYKDGNQECYFFADNNKIDALILVLHNRLRAIKNFTGRPGAITALAVFYTHTLKNKLIIDKTEQFTNDGIKWLCSLIKAGGRGLKLKDQTGKYPDADKLYQEWQEAMKSDSHGPTSIIIESNIKRNLYKRNELLMIPTIWLHESTETYDRLSALKASEVLLEYNRQVTANQVGNRLLLALAKDSGALTNGTLNGIRTQIKTLGNVQDPQALDSVIDPTRRAKWTDYLLQVIESQDPTTNKAYTPWLAKMYSKGGLRLEDMNRGDLLRFHDVGKKRRMIKPEHSDINRFRTYKDFEDVMLTGPYDLNAIIPDEEDSNSGKAQKVYNDSNVTIIVPEDEDAACKYGRNTRWCTASTRGHNMFNQYNRQGKLYILIPKKPKYEGEKYQLHFPSNSYMDENDDPMPLSEIFIRFPGIKEFFVQNEPELQNKILFISDDQLAQAIESIAEMVQESVWEKVGEWEQDDDSYRRYLRDEGYVDEEGNIDWDKAAKAGLSYSEYNPDVERWSRDIMNIVTPTPEQLRDIIEDDPYEFQTFDTMKKLPDVIGTILRNHYSGRRDEGDANIGQYLREKVSMRKEGDKWRAYFIPSLRLPR